MNTINVIIQIIIALCVISVPVGFIVGIVLAVLASNEQEKSLKKKKIIWMVISFISPIVVLFVILSLWGLYSIVTHM